MSEIYSFEPRDITGQHVSLEEYRGKVLLIVNTASECGFTRQYQALEQLYEDYRDRGFEVLGFPCNQFGGQEPGDAREIASFCKLRHNITFPMFDKVEVNGPHANRLFRWLKEEKPGLLGSKAIKWNFTKFLVDRTGRVTGRFAPATKPEAIRPKVKELL
ncbi:glutathione peroxidase [Altericroceibacterium xinjiangense]|uniref:glutathione peroxidase n=1 Tax=Altericroceibacterium xinjiangense TaxID=762261 RepID=UPI000F7DB586|nr:glutathione peroxidase [Altericroceibacterium xinjiangense]